MLEVGRQMLKAWDKLTDSCQSGERWRSLQRRNYYRKWPQDSGLRTRWALIRSRCSGVVTFSLFQVIESHHERL